MTQSISSSSTSRGRSDGRPTSGAEPSPCGSSSTKPTSSRRYSGWALILRSTIRATSPVPTISVRRGCMIAGSSQLRTDPRVSSTSGSAVARNMAASTGKNTSAPMIRRSTWLRIRKTRDPAMRA